MDIFVTTFMMYIRTNSHAPDKAGYNNTLAILRVTWDYYLHQPIFLTKNIMLLIRNNASLRTSGCEKTSFFTLEDQKRIFEMRLESKRRLMSGVFFQAANFV